jgi:Tfp pilus assembly protein PilF/DNA-binding transcriptional MerR regulator
MDRPSPHGAYSTREVASLLGLSPAQIRSCVRAGFVAPQAGPRGELLFSFQDLILLRTAKALIAARIPRRRIRIALENLHSQLPQGQPLTAVRISAQGHHVVARDGGDAWHPESGQTLLDFEVADLAREAAALEPRRLAPQASLPSRLPAPGTRPPAEGYPPPRPRPFGGATLSPRTPFRSPSQSAPPGPGSRRGSGAAAPGSAETGAHGFDTADARDAAADRSTGDARTATGDDADAHDADAAAAAAGAEADAAADWYEHGVDLEAEDPGGAMTAYRRALEIYPDLVDAHLNLGRLLHEAGNLAAAESHYRQALAVEPDDALAAYNLGVALQDQHRRREAVAAYEHAIAIDPAFADAHFNLSGVYEQLGDKTAAFRHLRTYRSLTGNGGPAGAG